MYQAVENQARKVGDGTTTLLIFYTNLYKRFRGMVNDFKRIAPSVNIVSISEISNAPFTNITDALSMIPSAVEDDS